MVQIFFDDKGIKYDQYAFYQYDYGRTLVIQGLELPTNVQVHFARKHVPAEIVIGTTVDNITTVRVPASTLQYPGEFNVYIYVADETTGQTYRTITFHTRAREKPADYAPPDEPNVVQQLMDKLDKIIETGIADYEPNIDTVNDMIDAYVKANMIANNDATTIAGFAWDARRGKAIRDDLTNTNLAVTTINNNLARTTGTLTAGTNITMNVYVVEKRAGIVHLTFQIQPTAPISAWSTVATLPAGFTPANAYYSDGATQFQVGTSIATSVALETGSVYRLDTTFVTNN